MNTNKAVIVFKGYNMSRPVDLELSLNITAAELILGLNEAYGLGIDINTINTFFLRAENPIALLKGNKTLGEYGIHNGSLLFYDQRDK